VSDRWICTVSLLLLTAAAVRGEAVKSILQGDKEPLLCLQTGGPTALVTALAFSPDGKTLYATGFDKVVRVWALLQFISHQTVLRINRVVLPVFVGGDMANIQNVTGGGRGSLAQAFPFFSR
jgi:WD40 repeat protein